MNRLVNTAGIFALGMIVVALASGCAAKKAPAAASAEAAPAPAAVAPAGPDTSYTVARGDHLWGISSMPRIYGNPYQWPLIYKANSNQIKDADLIYPGQNLTIDRNASASEIQRSVKHAKNRGAWSLGVVESTDKAYLGGN